ncbi:uncharacterized protein EV154DRAFT_471453 [Mucor mucedo]|uniref:uncharacterized protein n=1 Tax=Mucor mucedo TaxID=29922 RepID=UPI0022202575|nr:uncharacterized protein EV154DRAFT_471453 [Mucor mucedo]KAI7881499.1 hypothetical protein EV154DRAFT_471453 [Mucor mucedo]
MWPSSNNEQSMHPLDPTMFLNSWDPNGFPAHLNSDDWDLGMHPQDSTLMNDIHKQSTYTLSGMPPTPPVHNYNYASNTTTVTVSDFGYGHNAFMGNSAMNMSTPNSITPPLTNYYPSRHSLPTTSSSKKYGKMLNGRRCSAETTRYGRRASSHPSVASVVSLTAHEPVSKIVDGIEYITFLYSHDRLVKEYTVRTDVDHVNLDDISMDFRTQNAIYPRANVDRSEYDGNRWDYETTCNQLGWKLCWLNKEQLFGRRGLIQRAVDSYRNRHAEMRSRRVTRQEKVANGTLRKRRSKKALNQNIL